MEKMQQKKYIKSVCDFIDGIKVMAKWQYDDAEIECLLVKQNGGWFLLQDKHDGNDAKDKKGYKFSWGMSPNWKEEVDSITFMYVKDDERPLCVKLADEKWKKFEETLEFVKVYAKSMSGLDKLEELIGKLEKLAK